MQAVVFYWVTTNVISVLQARLVRMNFIRAKLGIPKMTVWTKDKLPKKEKGFRETLRECKCSREY